ncbi:MAG: hypothetical protein AAFU80_05555 [Pseudomonadota bacterium]
MLAALGFVSVLMAGLAVPFAFEPSSDEPESDDNGDGEDGAPTDPSESGASPLDIALSDTTETGLGLDENGQERLPEVDFPAFLPDPIEPEEMQEGSAGNDTLDGDEADDFLLGGAGDDALDGGFGDDKIQGEEGDDWIWGDFGDDHLAGQAGDDRLIDGAGDDTLDGGDGNDTLIATTADGEWDFDGRDDMFGGDGDDTLVTSGGDVAHGGEGADTFFVGPGIGQLGAGGAPQIADFEPGTDRIVVVWNDFTSDTQPELSIETREDEGGGEALARILLDGKAVAEVARAEGLSLDAVELLRASRFRV